MQNKFQISPPEEMEVYTLAENRKKLEELLCLEKPLTDKVFNAALGNPLYLHHLLSVKDFAVMRDHLLANPPASAPPRSRSAKIKTPASELDLMKKATKAIWNWGKSGFKTVDEETYERRFSACMSCEHIQDPPDTMLYKLTTITKKDQNSRKSCNLCGCVVSNKANLPDESCPADHLVLEGMTRWGEPRK